MNRICLIGLVGCWPRPVGPAGDLGFVLLTERDPLGQRVDRHRVILGGIHLPDISDFAPGATVYVEGHLARQGESRRVSVIAGCAWSILPAPPTTVAGEPTSRHASPREHQRSGMRAGSPSGRRGSVWSGCARPRCTHEPPTGWRSLGCIPSEAIGAFYRGRYPKNPTTAYYRA